MCFCLQFTLYLVNCLFSCFTLLYHVFSTKIPHIVMIRDTGEVPKVAGQEELMERIEKPSPEIFAGARAFSLDRDTLDRASHGSIERTCTREFRSSEVILDRARAARSSESEPRSSETFAEVKRTLSIKGKLRGKKGDRKSFARLRLSVHFEGIGAPDLRLGRKIEGFNA